MDGAEMREVIVENVSMRERERLVSWKWSSLLLSKSRGFTLVEVMIALVVLLVGMLGVMSMQYYAVSGNTFSREMRIAVELNEQMIEQAKSTPYANLANGTDNPPVGPAISGGRTYTRRWWVLPNCITMVLGDATCNAAPNCTTVPDGGVASAASAVTARTCWTDRNGGIHSVTANTVRWNENVTP